MLSRDPKKRPTLPELMKDPFFSDIDWDKLANKEIEPPQVLSNMQGPNRSDDLSQNQLLQDTDYTESDEDSGRVRNYSFTRE